VLNDCSGHEACVVDKDINATPFLCYIFDQFHALITVGDIETMEPDVFTRRDPQFRESREGMLARREHQPKSVQRKQMASNGQSKSSTGSRDDDHRPGRAGADGDLGVHNNSC
jgi:hypothetical protein